MLQTGWALATRYCEPEIHGSSMLIPQVGAEMVPDADALSFDYTGIARCGTMMIGGERGSPPQSYYPGYRR